jgi:hypothetical protein
VAEEKSDSTAYAIVLLTVVIAIIGGPFAYNEYNKMQEREQLSRIMSQPVIVNHPITLQKTITRVITPIPTPIPTPFTTYAPKITDGFWCRFTTKNIGKDPTDVTECYQFFTDGTFKWGYSPGYPMGKSPSCWSPDVKCVYSYNSNGKYEVQGGYSYTLSGINLIDPHDPPYFVWRATGIP